jgi:flagellar biosynthesis protein FlhG
MDGLEAANPHHTQKVKLLRHLRAFDADYVVLDLGAGTSFNVLDFFLLADIGVVVLLPEPTSIENAYRFIKAAFFRRLQAAPEDGFAELMGRVLAPRDGSPGRSPWQLVSDLRLTSPEKANRLEALLTGFHPWLIVNQTRSRADFDVGPTVAAAWRKFFGLELGYLGAVGHDEAVWRAVRARKSLLGSFPTSSAATGVLRVAENLIALGR